MRFTLQVDIDQESAEQTVQELGRILRYWAGNLKHYPLEPGAGEKIYDSAYTEVGSWTFTSTPPNPPGE